MKKENALYNSKLKSQGSVKKVVVKYREGLEEEQDQNPKGSTTIAVGATYG